MEQYISAWAYAQSLLGAFLFPWGISIMVFIVLMLVAFAWKREKQ